MQFSDVSLMPTVAAFFAAFVSGFIWFGPKTFFPIWWKAMGRTEADVPGNSNMGAVFGLTIVGIAFQALGMSLVIGLQQRLVGDIDFAAGLMTGLVVGVCFSAASSLSHRMFAGHGVKVWVIETANDVINAALMGGIIAAMI